jgi:integrase
MGVLVTNPVRDLSPPPPNPPRTHFLELPEAQRLVEGSTPPFRAILALAYGGGLEISAILALVESDIDRQRGAVRARGSKAWPRDRIALIAPLAWAHVEAHLAGLTPGERVFRGIDRWEAGKYHRQRCDPLGWTGDRLHYARHHWPVECLRSGVPAEMIARQLGYRDAVMTLRVYRRFIPRDTEWDYWRDRVADRQNRPVSVPPWVPPIPRHQRTRNRKPPHPLLNARAMTIAGAGLEPATPAL